MARDEMFKTVSFGGYDKAVVDEYVAETNRSHQSDIADLKTTIGKLSETVRSLQVAKEQVKTAASEDIEKLKLELESSFEQTDKIKQQLESEAEAKKTLQEELEDKTAEATALRQKLDEQTGKCLDLTAQLEEEKRKAEEDRQNSQSQLAAVQAEKEEQIGSVRAALEQQIADLQAQLAQQKEELEGRLQQQREELENQLQQQAEVAAKHLEQQEKEAAEKLASYTDMQQELVSMREKEASYAGKYEAISKTLIEARERADKVVSDAETESREILEQAERQRQTLIAETQAAQEEKMAQTEADCDELQRMTQNDCDELQKATKEECQRMLAEAERQAAVIRLRIQEQCDNTNEYMEAMMLSIDNLAMACAKTREIAEAGFSVFQEEKDVPGTDAGEDASDGLDSDAGVEEIPVSGSEYRDI